MAGYAGSVDRGSAGELSQVRCGLQVVGCCLLVLTGPFVGDRLLAVRMVANEVEADISASS